MKTILILLLSSTSLFGQMTVTQESKDSLIGDIKSVKCVYSNDSYLFLYRNAKYTIVDIKSFSLNEIEFETFYNEIIKGIETPPETDVILETPRDIFYLTFSQKGVNIKHFVKKRVLALMYFMDKKSVNKLFGKAIEEK